MFSFFFIYFYYSGSSSLSQTLFCFVSNWNNSYRKKGKNTKIFFFVLEKNMEHELYSIVCCIFDLEREYFSEGTTVY